MSSLRGTLRIVLQLVLAGPALLFTPIVLPLALFCLLSALGNPGTAENWGKAFYFLFGALGELGLISSIFIPNSFIADLRSVCRVIQIFLCFGICVAALDVAGNFPIKRSDIIAPDHAMQIFVWVHLGSVFVGVWNIWRIFKHSKMENRPNP